MQPAEPHFAVVDGREGVVKRCFALAQRLDFSAHENDTAFVGVKNVVVMAGTTIGGHHRVVGADLFFLRLLLAHNLLNSSRRRCTTAIP